MTNATLWGKLDVLSTVVCAAFAFCARAWAVTLEVTGDELVTNGGFESGTSGWTCSGSSRVGYNSTVWVSSDMTKVADAGSYCVYIQSSNGSTGYLSQAIDFAAAGVYRISFAYATRSVNGKNYGCAPTTVALDERVIAAFTTTERHLTTEEAMEAYFYVDSAGSHTLKFSMHADSGDKSNLIDLVSVRKLAQSSLAIVEGDPDAHQNASGLPAYGMWQPSAGETLTAPASIDISRTETADLIGYDLYAATASADEPMFVESASYRVTAADAASFVRLVWKWNVRERKYPLDASLFSRKCTLTVSGYAGEATLTNFPLLVKLSEGKIANFSYGDLAADGGDLRFYDASGNFVAHEIDGTWNADGETLIWVRVPELPKGGTTLTMYYGSTDLDKLPPVVGSDVWRDYANVWHMNVASDWSVAESTTDAKHGTVMNTSDSALGVAGMIGGAFTNKSGQSAYVIVDPSDVRKAMTPPYTFSAWVYNDGNGGNNADIWNDKNNGAGCGTADGVEIGLEGGVETLITRGTTSPVFKGVPSFSKCWRHLFVVYDGGKSYAYFDGKLHASLDVGMPSFASTGKLSLGQRVGAGPCKWYGALDEMRIRAGTRLPDDWIAAEYANQANDSDFVSYGEVERTKIAVLKIGNAGFSLDGNTVTMGGQVSLDDYGDPATARVVYGLGEERTSATAEQTITRSGTISVTLSGLSWATRYTAQWEAWNQAKPDEKVAADVVSFTVDGTPQIDLKLNAAVVGKGVQISATVTELRGTEPVTVRLYRKDGDGDETLIETKAVSTAGKVDFAAQTLAWGVDYTYRATFEHVREGVGTWQSETAKLLVSVQDSPEKCKFSTFNFCSDILLAGYRGTEPLRDFPVLVRLSAGHPEGFDPALCGSNGTAIRFADQNGGLIPHEIDTWNPNGESLVWVRIPVLSGEKTRIRLYFGAEDLAKVPAVDSTAVWTNFFAVWHMDVAEGWGVKESAQYGLNGTVLSGNSADTDATDPSAYTYAGAEGLVGGSFTNSLWAYVSVPASEAFATLGSSLSFSAWVRDIGADNNAALWNNCNNGYSSQATYGVEITKRGSASIDARGSNSTQEVPLSKSLSGGWHHVTVVYTKLSSDKAGVAAYVDDDEATEPVGGVTVVPLKFWDADNLALGQRIGSSACRWKGNLDEMRISAKPLSADWVKAEYDTVTDPAFAVPGKAYFCRRGLMLILK